MEERAENATVVVVFCITKVELSWGFLEALVELRARGGMIESVFVQFDRP